MAAKKADGLHDQSQPKRKHHQRPKSERRTEDRAPFTYASPML
jgi:hypothetical protein